MYVCLDNSLDTKIVLDYSLGEEWQERVWEREGQSLLGCLAKLQAEVKPPKGITGLIVLVGQGRFTATRVATTVGNTLAYAWQVPIVAINNKAELAEVAKRLKQQSVGQYVLPTYSGEARIGGKAKG